MIMLLETCMDVLSCTELDQQPPLVILASISINKRTHDLGTNDTKSWVFDCLNNLLHPSS